MCEFPRAIPDKRPTPTRTETTESRSCDYRGTDHYMTCAGTDAHRGRSATRTPETHPCLDEHGERHAEGDERPELP